MGGIGGLFGASGGAGGTGFAGPAAANIVQGTDAGQLSTAYTGAQNSLASQQALLQAIQAQNGLNNQSQVYNQLQGVVNGTGPNPAQAQLAQATGANTANQAALMAGQRGAGANVGLIARQAGMQGAANQQNAAGQAATLQANQSLNALGAAGNLATTQAGQQIGATNANTQAQQAEQQILQNANAAQNNANVGMQTNINSANAGLANTQLQGQQAVIGGLMSGAGAAMGKAEGGLIQKYADGGVAASGPQSSFGKFLNGFGSNMSDDSSSSQLQNGMQSFAGAAMVAQGGNIGSRLKVGGQVPGKASVQGNSYANDKVKALLSPGEGVIDRETMGDKGPMGQMARTLIAAIEAKKRGKK